MSDPEDLLTSIDDYLLGLAEGIRSAQSELDRLALRGSMSSYGYHLPRVDFEFKMTIEMQTAEQTSGVTRPRPRMVMRPVSSRAKTSAEAISTIRGSFVAMPLGEGQPRIMARSSVEVTGPRSLVVHVHVSESSGSPISGVAVDFNVDRDLSKQSSAANGVEVELSGTTDFDVAVAQTSEEGNVSSRLSIDPDEPEGAVVVMVLDVADQTERIYHEVEGA